MRDERTAMKNMSGGNADSAYEKQESADRESERWENTDRERENQENANRERKSVRQLLSGWIENIRNTKVLHKLPVYEIEKAEKRYEAMAQKGWLLYRQGSSLEYFRRGEPQNLQYRIECCPVKALDGIQDLTEDQVDFYEDCGWSLASERSGVYVFSAPMDSEPMEIYSDPKEQIRMLKSVHHYVGNFATVFICCWFGTMVGKSLSGQQTWFSWEAFHCIDWIWICVALWMIYVLWEDIYAGYRCRLLIRRVKKGKPIHHLPEEKVTKYRIAKGFRYILFALGGITALGSAVMLLRVTRIPLAEVGEDRPYFLAGEVYEGERTERNIFGREEENSVLIAHALTADYYEVSEYLLNEDKDFVSLDQKVYVLREFDQNTLKRAVRLADSLLEGSVFQADGKRVLESPGFDYVATAQYALVAVKDNHVIRVTCVASDALEKDWSEVLNVIAEKWQ